MNDDANHARTTRRRLLAAGLATTAYAVAARATPQPASRSPERLHFRCPDGLGVELVHVDPARIWGLA